MPNIRFVWVETIVTNVEKVIFRLKKALHITLAA